MGRQHHVWLISACGAVRLMCLTDSFNLLLSMFKKFWAFKGLRTQSKRFNPCDLRCATGKDFKTLKHTIIIIK